MPLKKGRIRASDLAKDVCSSNETCKYEWRRIIDLKGPDRDRRNTGRPAGVTSSAGRGNHQQNKILKPANLEDVSPMELSTEHSSSASGGISEKDEVYGPQCRPHLTDEEAYQNLLKENAAVYCLDDHFQHYALQDFDSANIQLKAWKFQFVSRRAILFRDGQSQWVYKCSCNAVTSDLVDCCEDQMEVPFNEFKTRMGDCLHTSTLSVMLENFDAQNQITPEVITSDDPNTSEIEREESVEDGFLELKEGLFVINSPEGYGVIQRHVDGYKCLTCQAMICRCIHLSLFLRSHEEDVSRKSKQPSYRQKCYSVQKIPFNSTNSMTEIYRKSTWERFPEEAGDISFKVEEDLCAVCGCLLEEADRVKANLFMFHQILQAYVSSKKCPLCDKQYYFDGFSFCVLNMGRNLFCHEILRRFMFYFLTGKTTIFTEYSVLRKTFNDSRFHDFEEKMSYQDFREAWYAFLDLLDINYQDSFICPKCGPSPDTLVMDATSVAFRKELISWENMFNTAESQNLKPYDKIDTARVRERTLCSRMVRSMLMDFTRLTKGLTMEQQNKVLHLIRFENESEELVSLFNVIFNDSIRRGDRIFASEIWRDFVKVLASPCPLCSFLPPSEDFFSFLHETFSQKENVLRNDVPLKRLQTTVPVLFRLLMTMKAQFPFVEFQNCLQYFQQKVFDPFLKDPCPSEEADGEDNLSFFPSLQKIRKRGVFVADRKGTKMKEDMCTKFSKGHPSLLPGVFTLFCPDGICYGFEVMKVHESPDVPFTLLRTRFEEAPKLIVYDNACTLQVYCLNRDPTFFIGTEFRVDGLHYRNHKACGPSFELKSYPQYATLNSQVVEQSNSRLQRIKGSLSYMTQTNFMKHCRFYLWGQNYEVMSKFK